MTTNHKKFSIRKHCHINSNSDGDTFVGVRADSNNVVIYFPIGYELPLNDDEIRVDIKNLLNILSIFTDKSDRILHMEKNSSSQIVEFPIQAYLNIINYYLDHNGSYYTETEITYKVDKRGKTDWNRTIKTQKPMIQGKSILYFNQVVRISTPNRNRLITRINKYCVYESLSRIGWLYTINNPEKPDIIFEKNLFISVLNDKISSTNNDTDKALFKSMIAMIEYMDNKTTDKQFYFGTDNFEIVWEKLIDKFFGEPNKRDYFPHGKWTERYGPKKGRPASALEPDSIMIYKDKYYVLDAKYYRYGVLPEFGISSLPQSSDINKQITYSQFVKNRKTPHGAQGFNAFIMPFNKENNKFNINSWCGNVAEAVGDWITNPETYERIQGLVVDTRYILKNYDGNHYYDKGILSLEIEKFF